MRAARRGSLLVLRELTRLARRPSTFWTRGGVTGLVCLAIWIGWSTLFDNPLQRITTGGVGRPIFMVWVSMMWLCVIVLAPLLSALAVLEEREESTLELLALTGIRPEQLVLGKVGSRVVVIVTFVIGTAPLVAAVLSLGGVAPMELVTALVQMVWVASLLALIAGSLAPVLDGLMASAGVAWAWIVVVSWLPAVHLNSGMRVWTGSDPSDWALASLLPLAPTASGDGLLSVLATLPVVAVCLLVQPVAVLRGTGRGLWTARWESRLHYGVMLLSMLCLVGGGAGVWLVYSSRPGFTPMLAQGLLLGSTLVLSTAFLGLMMTVTIESTTWRRSGGGPTERSSRAGTMRKNPLWWRAWATQGLSPGRGAMAVVALVYVGASVAVWRVSDRSDELFTVWLVVGVYGSLLVSSLTAAGVSQVDLADGRGELMRLTTLPAAELASGQLLSVLSRSGLLAILAVLPWGLHRCWVSLQSARSTALDEWSPGPENGDVLAAVSHASDVLPVLAWVLLANAVFAAGGLAIAQRARSPRIGWVLCITMVPTFVVFQVLVLIFDECSGSRGMLSQLLVPLLHNEVTSSETLPPVVLLVSSVLWAVGLLVVLTLVMEGWRPSPDGSPSSVAARRRRDTSASDV